MKLATQLRGMVMPIRQPIVKEKARPVGEDEKKFRVFVHLRKARANKRLKGYREKKAKEASEDPLGGKKK